MNKIIKKAAAFMLAAVMLIGTSFSSAAGGITVGSSDNILTQRIKGVNIDGSKPNYSGISYTDAKGGKHPNKYTRGVIAKIKSNGKPLYCIEYAARMTDSGGGIHGVDKIERSAAWEKLKNDAKKGVKYALIYGYPNFNYGYTANEAQWATQVLIWEYCTNKRTSANSTDVTNDFHRAFKNQSKYTDGVSINLDKSYACYKKIVASIKNHKIKPNFSPSSVSLKGVGEANGVWVEDSTGNAKNFTLTNWPSGIGAQWNTQHTKLKIYAIEAKPIKGTLRFTKNFTLKSEGAILVQGSSDSQALVYGQIDDPVTTNISVTLSTGSLTIKKTCEWGSCWQKSFLITGPNGYKNQVWIMAKHLNDSQGRTATLTLTDLTAGKYTVSEVGRDSGESIYQADDGNKSRTVTVTAGGTATTTFTNTPKNGTVEVIKTSEDGVVDGIKIRIHGTDYKGSAYDQSFITANGGKITQQIAPGNYTAEEVLTAEQENKYFPTDPVSFEVKPNEKSKVEFENVTRKNRIKIIKKDENGALVNGCTFGVFTDEKCKVRAKDYENKEVPDIAGNKYTPGLVSDVYFVKELSCPEDYELDPEVKKVDASAGELFYNVTFVNKFKSQKIWFYKTSENGGYIRDKDSERADPNRFNSYRLVFTRKSDGITSELTLTSHDGNHTQTGDVLASRLYGPLEKVGLDKSMIFGYKSSTVSLSADSFFKPGQSYSVEEKNTDKSDPHRVYRLIKNQEFTIPNDDSWKKGIAILLENAEKKGTVQITKTADDGFISDITFRLHGTSLNKYSVDLTAQTDENGVAKFENVPLGSYTVEELDTESRYHEFKPIDVSVTEDGKTYYAAADNPLKYAGVELHKTSEDGVLQGFTFLLMNTVTGSEATATTDENGIARFKKLPIYAADNSPITYTLSEIDAPIRYEKIADKTFTLEGYESADDSKVFTIDFENPLRKSPIEIIKHASDGVIEGVRFSVMSTANGATDFYTTDENGKITSKNYQIYDKSGNKISYVISEVNIDGRYLPTKSQTVTLSPDEPTVVEFSNIEKKGNLKILKSDSETGELLSGAEFMIFRDIDGDGKYTDGVDAPYDRKPVETAKGIYELKDMLYGKYLAYEITPPPGHYLEDKYYAFSITEDGATVTVEIENEPMKGTIQLIKADSETKKTLSGAEFTVYNDVDGDGKYNANVDTVAGVMRETAEKGHYEIKGLLAANYLVKETKAPKGFVCDEKYYSFTVNGAGDYTVGA